MAQLYLVRHGKAAAGFAAHKDPGLDELGQTQAETIGRYLQTHINSPIAIVSSPLARAYQTAQPLAQAWKTDIAIESRVAEIPSPTDDLAERAAWLGQAMQGSWTELDPPFQAWRQALAQCLLDLSQDTVIFSHFVAINAAVGLAENDPRMRIFSPDNASVTVMRNDDGQLAVDQLGLTADTHVN